MKIQYVSDLHLSMPENREYITANPIKPVGDILILGGDITSFHKIHEVDDFFNYISDNFKITYWLPGNHDYYGYNGESKFGIINEKIRDNIFLVNNICVKHEGVNIILSTLWSHIPKDLKYHIESSINDFRLIKVNGSIFNVEEYNANHNYSLLLIKKMYNKINNEKVVVFTHHVPTLILSPHFKKTTINSAFCTNLDDFINSSNISNWVYGHNHYNAHDIKIGGTRLSTNQLGYVSHNEHHSFNPKKFLEV